MNDVLNAFQPLIHKTMHRLNIKPNHNDYDDFFQELQIQFLDIFSKFEKDGGDLETERYQFTAFAGQGLYWHGVNLFQKKGFYTFETVEEEQLDLLGTGEDLADAFLITDFLRQAQKKLAEEEYVLLEYLVRDHYTIQELADFLQVSPYTVYRRKKEIQRKLQDLKQCLIN